MPVADAPPTSHLLLRSQELAALIETALEGASAPWPKEVAADVEPASDASDG